MSNLNTIRAIMASLDEQIATFRQYGDPIELDKEMRADLAEIEALREKLLSQLQEGKL